MKPLSLILIVTSIATPCFAQIGSKSLEYNKQITSLLRQGNCDAAESIANQAESQDKYLSYLPEWYHQIIDCHKKKHEGWGDLNFRIYEFFNRNLDRFINEHSCSKAEKYINTIDNKFFSSWSFLGGLYKIANCYENVDSKKSAFLYRQIMSEHENDYSTGAKQRLQYLTGDHSWIFSSETQLINSVKDGIRRRDIDHLRKYASKSNFQLGFEEEWMPEVFDENGKAVLKSAFDRSEPKIVYVNSVPHRAMMLVVFSAEDHPFWCFTFDEMEGGWQWTGVIIAGWQKEYITSDDYFSYKDKICVPSKKSK